MTGAVPDLRLDTAEVAEVIAFCRKAELIATAAAADLGDHDFGRWAGSGADDHYGDLRRRYTQMATAIADRLARDGADAGALGERLHQAMAVVIGDDEQAAVGIRSAGIHSAEIRSGEVNPGEINPVGSNPVGQDGPRSQA